jgi:hypothetical protein
VTIQVVPAIGSRPDDSIRTVGAIQNALRVWPHPLGIKCGPQIDTATFSTNVAAAQPFGAARLADSGYTYKRYYGTAVKLYELSTAGVSTDRSRAVGGNYGASQTNSWSFAQFGAISLAINKIDQLQQRTLNSATAFANVATAPKADVMFVCGPAASPFVMLLNYNDGTDVPDGWYCSAISDYTGWTAGTNQSTKGQITDNNGPLVAGIPYRDGAIVFKEDGMWAGEYVGAPINWAWRKISSDIGCIGKRAVIAINDVIYFAARDGIYMYDGSYPRKMPGAIHDDWANDYLTYVAATAGFPNGSASMRGMHAAMAWPQYHLVAFIMYSSNGAQKWLWFNTRSGMFINETRWITDGFWQFVDPFCWFTTSTYTVRSLIFDNPASTTCSFVIGPVGGDSPALVNLRSARPQYELSANAVACSITPYPQHSDFLLGALSDKGDQSAVPVAANATPGAPGATGVGCWADFSDQSITANFIFLKLQWVLASDFYGDVIVKGAMFDIASGGSDHD